MNELEIICHPRVDGLSIFFNTVDYRTPHLHPEWELILVVENVLAAGCGGKEYLLYPGQMILFYPNEPHEFHKVKENATFLCMQISPSILPKLPDVCIEDRRMEAYLTKAEIEEVKKIMADCMRAYLAQEDWFSLYCIGWGTLLLQKMLTRLPICELTQEEAQRMNRKNARLSRLLAFVDENYMHKIRLTDFAKTEGCSVSYLSRFIKNTMNQSFQEYVTSVRFHSACERIAKGEERLLDICMESGFSDYRYFSKEFQKQYGQTPEEYRRHWNQSRQKQTVLRHSLHSVERFYTAEESLELVEKYFKI